MPELHLKPNSRQTTGRAPEVLEKRSSMETLGILEGFGGREEAKARACGFANANKVATGCSDGCNGGNDSA